MRFSEDLDGTLRAQGPRPRYPLDLCRQNYWPDDSRGLGFHRAADLWKRRKRLIVIVFALIIGATLAKAFLTPRSYEAVLKIFIKRARIETLGVEADTTNAPPADGNESDMRSEIEILRSRDLLEKVVVKCHLASTSSGGKTGDRRLLAAAVRKLEKDLVVAPISKTNIVAIKYSSRNANRSANVLKVLAALYIEKHTAMHRSHETSQFFTDQANRYHADLVRAQEKLADFQQRYGVSLLDERKQLSLKRIGDLEAAIQQLNAAAEDANDRVKVFMTERESLPVTIETQSRTARNEGLLDKLKSTLLDLQNKRVELLTKFEPGYPLVVEVEQQIRATQDAIRREDALAVVDQTEALNPLRQSVEVELSHAQSLAAGVLAQRASLTRDLENSRAQEKTFEQVTAEYNDLQRRREISESNYLLYQKKTEEARIADALDQHKFLNVSILEEPVPPVLPVNRHSAFFVLLGSILAILSAFAAALTVDSIDPLIRNPAELTIRTGVPVLASVSGARLLPGAGYESDAISTDEQTSAEDGADRFGANKSSVLDPTTGSTLASQSDIPVDPA